MKLREPIYLNQAVFQAVKGCQKVSVRSNERESWKEVCFIKKAQKSVARDLIGHCSSVIARNKVQAGVV